MTAREIDAALPHTQIIRSGLQIVNEFENQFSYDIVVFAYSSAGHGEEDTKEVVKKILEHFSKLQRMIEENTKSIPTKLKFYGYDVFLANDPLTELFGVVEYPELFFMPASKEKANVDLKRFESS